MPLCGFRRVPQRFPVSHIRVVIGPVSRGRSYRLVHEQLTGATELQHRRYEINLKELCFEVGDLVWLYQPTVKRGTPPKLHLPWSGPFVIKWLSDLVYQIQDGPRCRMKIIHNRFKPHHGQTPPWQEKKGAELQGKDPVEIDDTDSPAEQDEGNNSHQAEGADQTAALG